MQRYSSTYGCAFHANRATPSGDRDSLLPCFADKRSIYDHALFPRPHYLLLAAAQLGQFISEGELCRCVLQSGRIFEQSLFPDRDRPDGAISARFEEVDEGKVCGGRVSTSCGVVGDRSPPPFFAERRPGSHTFTEVVEKMLEVLPFRRLEEVGKR